MNEISKRISLAKDFKWMPGMLAIRSNGCEYRVAQVVFGDEEYPKGRIANGWGDWGSFTGAHPDLEDPATLGCLIELAKNKLFERNIYFQYSYEDSLFYIMRTGPRGKDCLFVDNNFGWGEEGCYSPTGFKSIYEAIAVVLELENN